MLYLRPLVDQAAMWGRSLFPDRASRLVGVVAAFFILLALGFNLITVGGEIFVYQADAFLHGQLHLLSFPQSLIDLVPHNGRWYSPLGPLPAVLLVPFVPFFGTALQQHFVLFPVTLGVGFFVFLLAQRFGYGVGDRIWLALAFVFASVYVGVAYIAQAWNFASALSAVLSLATLYEYLGKRRFWLLGCLVGAIFATRFTAGLVGLLVLLDTALDSGIPWRERVQKLGRFLVPIVVVGILLLWYNYARFGNMFDNGYLTALIRPEMQVAARAQYGLFNLKLIPSNIYHYFLAPPQAVIDPRTMHLVPPYLKANVTMGFFLLSPIFLAIFFGAKLKNRFLKLTALVALLMTVVLLSYYAINYFELGPRYLVDVLPLYFILLLASFPGNQLLTRHRLLILVSAVFNVWMFVTHPSFLAALSKLPQ